MVNNYKRAIEILSELNEQTTKALLFKIATIRPSVIVECVDGKGLRDLREACAKCDTKIDAVRLWREKTGSTLRESMEAVESIPRWKRAKQDNEQ